MTEKFEFMGWPGLSYPANFENGIPIAPIIADYYENISAKTKQGWTSISDVKFYDWLNEPSEEDPLYGQTNLPVSRLAAYIHSLQCYPFLKILFDIYGQDRLGFLDWFSGLGNWSFNLDDSFLVPTRRAVTAHYNQLSYKAYGNQPQPPAEKLKILIISAPRTGNNWLMTILSHLYDLPAVEINQNSNPDLAERNSLTRFGINVATLEKLGPRWVGYYHMHLNYAFVEWARSQGIILLTTLRHPADTLVSLYHFVNTLPTTDGDDSLLREMLVEKNDKTNAIRYHFEEKACIKNYARWHYHHQLFISYNWLLSGASHTVRYEDLRYNPVAVLQQLSEKILPASQQSLKRALLLADFKLVQSLTGNRNFYRRGEVGTGQAELPPEVIEYMQTDTRYQLFFQRLGYTLDTTSVASPSLFNNPFQQIHKFDNGVALKPILIKCFLTNWGKLYNQPAEEISHTGENSFFQWLNKPSAKEKPGWAAVPYISNLADFLYRERNDVQEAFPAIYQDEQTRLAFLNWFVRHGLAEYELDSAFGLPMGDLLTINS